MTQLADGFRESRKYIEEGKSTDNGHGLDNGLVQSFLDKTLTSRLGMRILAENYLSLREEKPNYVGIINVQMNPKDMVDKWCTYVTELSERKYGRCPEFKLNGHLHAAFPYIETPLDYILPELLKNAVR